jgi:hypothetical protein
MDKIEGFRIRADSLEAFSKQMLGQLSDTGLTEDRIKSHKYYGRKIKMISLFLEKNFRH